MSKLFSTFLKEEKGAPIVEIIILIAMVAGLTAVMFPVLRINLGCWFNATMENIGQGIGGGQGTPETVIPVEIPSVGGGW